MMALCPKLSSQQCFWPSKMFVWSETLSAKTQQQFSAHLVLSRSHSCSVIKLLCWTQCKDMQSQCSQSLTTHIKYFTHSLNISPEWGLFKNSFPRKSTHQSHHQKSNKAFINFLILCFSSWDIHFLTVTDRRCQGCRLRGLLKLLRFLECRIDWNLQGWKVESRERGEDWNRKWFKGTVETSTGHRKWIISRFHHTITDITVTILDYGSIWQWILWFPTWILQEFAWNFSIDLCSNISNAAIPFVHRKNQSVGFLSNRPAKCFAWNWMEKDPCFVRDTHENCQDEMDETQWHLRNRIPFKHPFSFNF